MADTPEQIAHKSTREYVELESKYEQSQRKYAQSLQEIESLVQKLNLENSLWRTDENDSRLDRLSQSSLMHRLESLDDIWPIRTNWDRRQAAPARCLNSF